MTYAIRHNDDDIALCCQSKLTCADLALSLTVMHVYVRICLLGRRGRSTHTHTMSTWYKKSLAFVYSWDNEP